jgi:hypothetical protein
VTARALLAALLALAVPQAAQAAVVNDKTGDVPRAGLRPAERKALDITRVEAYPSATSLLVRVRLRGDALGRGRLKHAAVTVTAGRSTLSSRKRAKGLTVIRLRRRVDFLLLKDTSGLRRLRVRTFSGRRRATAAETGSGDSVTLDIETAETCARLFEEAKQLQSEADGLQASIRYANAPRRKKLQRQFDEVDHALAVNAVHRRSIHCPDTAAGLPALPPAPEAEPDEGSGGGPPVADFTVSAGGDPDHAAEAGAEIAFTDASSLPNGPGATPVQWNFGDGQTAGGTPQGTVRHAYAKPGRYTVTLTVYDDRSEWDDVTLDVYVRGPGSKASTLSAETGGDIPCPGAGETITVTVRIRVPSWAKKPITAGYTMPAGDCPGATRSAPRELELLAGNDGSMLDAWGRVEQTVQFKFDLSDGGGTGTTNPGVTASWS